MLGESWNEMDSFTKRVMIAVALGFVSVLGFGPWPAIVVFFGVLFLTPELGHGSHAAETHAARSPEPVSKPQPAPAAPKPVEKKKPAPAPAPAAGPALKAPPSGAAGGEAPMLLTEPVGGVADDLKLLKGVGPKLEAALNEMGFYHFDQIAAWTPANVAWVDETLEGVNRNRASRDGWVQQAKILATGALTDFAKRVEAGEVPTSQG